MIEFDADHEFLKKIRAHFKKESKSYVLETQDEIDMAKIFVKRGFLYYSGGTERVAPFDCVMR